MPLDLAPLYARAFVSSEATLANQTLFDAHDRFRAAPGGRSFCYEEVVPDDADVAWLERFVGRLVYHCESTRAPLPACAGVFVALFAGPTVHCVAAADVVAFAAEALAADVAELVRRHGTGESRVALPRKRD